MKNRFISAVAGSGKTTLLVREAIEKEGKVLITTYTEANEKGIRDKFIQKLGYIPDNVTIQTWFSFLLQHGVKPLQGSFNELMFDYKVKGMLLVNKPSGVKYTTEIRGRKVDIKYNEDTEFLRHYFTKSGKVYSDKISKFVFNCNKKVKGALIERLAGIYDHLMIDEVQDLAGYDLELIKLFMKHRSMRVLLVGDPRQVTYLTHHSSKHSKYAEGKIKDFLKEKCKTLIKDGIDEETLKFSHRNNQQICDYSYRLYPNLSKPNECVCETCRSHSQEHIGVFFIELKDAKEYVDKYKPVQLGWNKNVSIIEGGEYFNFGESKGLGFDRVLIYPTRPMKDWILNNSHNLKQEARSKLYVAVTRARHSVCFVLTPPEGAVPSGIKRYSVKISSLED